MLTTSSVSPITVELRDRGRLWIPIDPLITVEDIFQALSRSKEPDGLSIDFTSVYYAAPPDIRTEFNRRLKANQIPQSAPAQAEVNATRPYQARAWIPVNPELTVEDIWTAFRRSNEPDGVVSDFNSVYFAATPDVRTEFEKQLAEQKRQEAEAREAERAERRAWRRPHEGPQVTVTEESRDSSTSVEELPWDMLQELEQPLDRANILRNRFDILIDEILLNSNNFNGQIIEIERRPTNESFPIEGYINNMNEQNTIPDSLLRNPRDILINRFIFNQFENEQLSDPGSNH